MRRLQDNPKIKFRTRRRGIELDIGSGTTESAVESHSTLNWYVLMGPEGGGGWEWTLPTLCVFPVILTIYSYYFSQKHWKIVSEREEYPQHDMQTSKVNKADNKRQSQLSPF
jgi:hypothetical protein